MEDAKTLEEYAQALADELRKLPSAIGALEDYCNARRGVAAHASLSTEMEWGDILMLRGKAQCLAELLTVCVIARAPIDDQGEPEA